MTDSLTYNFKSRDASASKKTGDEYLEDQLNVDNVRFFIYESFPNFIFFLKLLWNKMPGSLKLSNHFFHRSPK